MIGTVGGTAVLAIAGGVGGFIGGYVASGGNLKAAMIGGVTGAMAGFIGGSQIFGNIGNITIERVVAHGVVGGISSEVSGDKFAQGFLSSAFTKTVSGKIQAITRNYPIVGATATAIVGGTASAISGGKFANGA